MKRIFFLCTLVISFQCLSEEIEKKGNQEVGMNESPLEGVKFSIIEANGIKMRLAEMGEGPLVLLAHGWPESWYSWRHQMVGLSKAGFRVIAPDMRGYGETDAPSGIDQYDIKKNG
mgnify:FL=1